MASRAIKSKAHGQPLDHTVVQESARSAAGRATDLDRVIHERVRLGIMSALGAGLSLTFHDLKQILQTSDGNLSVHARKLEEAGYVEVRKSFHAQKPRTEYEITPRGRAELERYLDHMEALIKATRSR